LGKSAARKPSKSVKNTGQRQPASKDVVRPASDEKVFAAAKRIAERDRELLKRLAR